MSGHRGSTILSSWILACLLGLPAASVVAQDEEAAAEEAGVQVVPPGGDPLGVPYEEWAAAWERWMLSTPLPEDPGEVYDCQAGQGGEVFFVGLPVAGVTLETRCVVGADQHILAPAAVTARPATEGDTAESMREGIEAELGAEPPIVTNASVTVDGAPVADLDGYQVISPLFEVEYIEDNIAGTEPGTTGQRMVGGWFVMLEPLAPGSHVIELGADIDVPGDEDGPLTTRTIASVDVVDAPASGGALSVAEAAAVYEVGSKRYNDTVRALEKKSFSTVAQGRRIATSYLENQQEFGAYLRAQAWPAEAQAAIDGLVAESDIDAGLLTELTRARNASQFQSRAAAVRRHAGDFNDAALAVRTALGLPVGDRLEEVTEE